MAVKKTAEKSVAKKTPAKKAVAKKAPVKKAVAKKAPVKKAVAKRSPSRILISDDSLIAPAIAISSMPLASALEPATKVSSVIPVVQNTSSPQTPQKSSSRVVLLVIVGVVLIAIAVVARNHNASVNNSGLNKTPAVTASASDTSSPTSMTTSSATPSSASSTTTTTTDLAPVRIVAHYTSFGATVFWAPAPGSSGLTTYNVETAKNGGAFKLLATVPATQTMLDVTKSDVVGWTSFRISAVYSDGGVVAGKVFGLPGQFS